MTRWFARNRSLILAVGAVAVVVALPARHGGKASAPRAQVATAPAPPAPAEPGSDAVDSMVAPSSGTGRVPATAGRAPARRTTAADAPVSTPVGGGPIGTAEALEAPDCDRDTTRLKLSSVYAPPCVPVWPEDADNGGVTSPGVTATTIKVVRLWRAGDGALADQQAMWQDYVDLYEHTFRMWGRRVEYVWVEQGGTDEAGQRADAIKIANLKPFAALGVGGYPVLLRELAARRIVVSDFSPPVKPTHELAPYFWGVDVANDGLALGNAAEYVGKKLLGRPARWAGQIEYQTAPRRFALLYPSQFDPSYFETEFAKYGGRLADKISFEQGFAAVPTYQERANLIVARMKEKGVTTVVTAGDILITPILLPNATQQQWFPEWFITGAGGIDIEVFARAFDQTQWRHAFGLSMWPVGGEQPPGDQWFFNWYWGGRSRKPFDTGSAHFSAWLYAGIHGAGPRLSPEAFRDGLFATPPAGGAARGAVMSNQVSYGRWGVLPWDDYQAWDDFGEVWWDATARGKDANLHIDGVGKYRSLNGGRRHLPGQWTSGEPSMFDAAGTAMWFDQYPANDRPPSHPCTGCPSSSS